MVKQVEIEWYGKFIANMFHRQYTASFSNWPILITPNPTHQFIYKSAWLWNQFRNTTSLTFSSKFSAVKNSLTQSLLGAQCRYGIEWNNLNFTEFWNKCLYFISTLNAVAYRQIAM